MARYVKRLEASNPNALTGDIAAFLQGQGYTLENYNGEILWKKGDGVWVAARCILIIFEPNAITITAFVNSMGAELGITGFYAFAIKKPLKKTVEALEKMISEKR